MCCVVVVMMVFVFLHRSERLNSIKVSCKMSVVSVTLTDFVHIQHHERKQALLTHCVLRVW